MRAIKLQTEFLANPIGIDSVEPRLLWNCEGGILQSAYRIIAQNENREVLWDSGKVKSNSMRAKYAGKPLRSRDSVTWQVHLWDENDCADEPSELANFELGLISPSDWKAHWITGNYRPNRKKRYPVDCFLKEFRLKGITKARLYIAACGIYEGQINGVRVGNFILAPGITDYRKRVQYQTYDVAALLREGKNAFTLELADGWYRGSVGAWGLRNEYGKETKLLAQLEITGTDGNTTVITTDESWKWSNDGQIREADNKDGEIVDANYSPSYAFMAKVTSHTVVPSASNSFSLTEHEVFKPKMIKTPSGKTVLDFGQNIAGYVSFSVAARRGQSVHMRFGEMLDQHGEFTQKNIQCVNKRKTTPLQRVEYTCKEGRNEYKTKFAIFGFQYVLIETDVDFTANDWTAIAVYSDMRQTAFFESSNELLNQFVNSTIWGAKGNSADVPTDCPTRERHAWTGDAQIFAGTAMYLFNFLPFARKFVRDMTDWQKKDGKFPQIAPDGGVDFYMNPLHGSVGWADAGVIIPFLLWKQYGDEQILHDNYSAMRNYAHFMQNRCGKSQLFSKRLHVKGEARKFVVNKGQAYGEWAEPTDVNVLKFTDMMFSRPEEATAYTCYVMELMEEIALFLGKNDDASEYRKFADGTRKAYQALVQTKGYSLDTDRQARLVRPLAFNLLNVEQTRFAKKRLLTALEHYGWRVGTGFLSTPLILDVLSKIDIESAYKLLENEEMPGWLYMTKSGANTVWESWEGITAHHGIASLNHYSKGACCEWVFRSMCGVQVAGENQFSIEPMPGGSFTFARFSYDSVYGTVKSSWERKDGDTVIHVSIPANTTAAIKLPDGRAFKVNCGVHQWTCK